MPNEIIPIPSPSPAASTASQSPSSAPQYTSDPTTTDDEVQPLNVKSISRKRRYLKERIKSCKDRTLESKLCRSINKFFKSCLSDDKLRRFTAIAIMVLAVIGLYHVIITIIL